MSRKGHRDASRTDGDPSSTLGALCHTTLDALRDPIHVVDADLRIILVNDTFERWCRDLGVETLAVGRTLSEAFPFLPDRVRSEYRHVFRSGRTLLTEESTIVGDRQIITETEKIPVVADGKVARVITVVRDITDRRRAETALRESEERLRAILGSLHETAIVVYDFDGRLVSAWSAPKLQERYGLTIEEVRGKRIHDFYPPSLADQRLRNIREVFRSGQSRREEFKVRLPGGEFWFEALLSPMGDASGKVAAVVAFVHDETERMRAVAALRDSEEKFRFLAENANDIVYAVDAGGTFTYISQHVADYGVRPEEMMVRNVLEFVVPEDRERVAADFRRTIETGQEFPTEFRVQDPKGGVHWLEDRGRARRDEAGRVVGLTGVLRDITERKLAESALREAHAKLVKARELERRRLARELHDSVGQAMIAMHLRLQSARAEAAASANAPLAKSLEGLSNQCNEVIREVRQISHGLFPPTLEQFGLPSALQQLVSVCQGAGIQAAVRFGRGLRRLRFAEDVEIALFRIAQEAVNNAIRHGHCKHVDVTLRRSKGRLVLEVVDDGGGFDCAKARGTGMGLSSMRGRSEAIGGTTRLTSQPGRTCVQVTVPLGERPQQQPARPNPD